MTYRSLFQYLEQPRTTNDDHYLFETKRQVEPQYVKAYIPTEENQPPFDPPSPAPQWKNDPSDWGSHLWYYLHYSAAKYPLNPSPQQAKQMEDWLCSLPITIPCRKCSVHYNQYINSHKSELNGICKNKDRLFEFLVDIHNEVNKKNGKPIMSYENARRMYK